jgi:hypothetical protein
MALNTLQGHNSNSSCRTGLQCVFVRPRHLYTQRPLSLPRTVPPLHVCSSHVLRRGRTDTANQRGGSEWEPIKILLEGDRNSNKMNTTSNTRLRLTTQVGQAHVATGVPLDLGTKHTTFRPENAAEHQTSSLQTNIGQTGEHHRSDQWGAPV